MDNTAILHDGASTAEEVDTMFDLGGAIDGAGCGLVLLFFSGVFVAGTAVLIKMFS